MLKPSFALIDVKLEQSANADGKMAVTYGGMTADSIAASQLSRAAFKMSI